MLTRLLVVLFSGLVLQQKSLADESYGYLRNDGFYEIPCTTDPAPGECSFKHEVADISRMTQSQAGTSPAIALLQLRNVLQMISGDMGPKNPSNELCVKTVRDHLCKMTFQFTCTDEYILQDINGVKKSCKKAEKYCVNATGFQSTLPNGMINCSGAIPPVERIKRQRLKCERFPDVKDDPLPCSKRNYKVLAVDLTGQSRSQIAAHERLARYASNISEECLNNVSDMICKGVAPACDRNETMVVEFLSRQDCERIISCLNTTSKVKNFQEGMMDWCSSSLDASTATKIPLSLVYTEFEDKDNDTKISTTPTTLSPIPNKTDQTQSRNVTGESDGPNTPTNRPFLNSTDSPSTQANITKTNAKSKPATEKPTVNATYQEKEKKEVPSLTPTTESLLNPNYTTQNQQGTELSKTPQLNATSSPVVSRVNATGGCVYNVTTTSHSILVSVNCSNSTIVGKLPKNPCNKAAQFNTRMNALAFLVISFLSICMWQ